jgi:hypothetical protein
MCVGVTESQITLKYINTLNVAQQCFCCKFMSPGTKEIIRTNFEKNNPTKLHSFHPVNAVVEHKNIPLLMTFF